MKLLDVVELVEPVGIYPAGTVGAIVEILDPLTVEIELMYGEAVLTVHKAKLRKSADRNLRSEG